MSSLKYWLWLATRRGVGSNGMLRVLEHFGTPERAYFADPGEYRLLPQEMRPGLLDRSLDAAEQILADCDRLDIRIMTLQDADYPERLRQLSDPPCVLYLKGKLPAMDDEVAIGVVGTRKATEYGCRTAGRLGLELARSGAVLVSGTAVGIDSSAIKGALQGGGRVVSVLGGGADVPYPWKHRGLYEDVAATGLLIGEYPPGTENLSRHFPIRNRIISGLSLGIVVVEAPEFGSGAMITALKALEQSRDVFAVPGSADAVQSRGCNRLIQQGAKLVMSAGDILSEYQMIFPHRLNGPAALSPEAAKARLEAVVPPPEAEPEKSKVDNGGDKEYSSSGKRPLPAGLTDDQLAVLNAMGSRSCQADEVVELTQIPARRVLSALTMLQLDGCVEEGPGRRFRSLVELPETVRAI